MAGFEPLINLLVVLSALSLAAERITNIIKLNRPGLRAVESEKPDALKIRENRITLVNLAVSTVLAIAVKADFLAILNHLDSPWETLGWARQQGPILHATVHTAPAIAYAVLGSALTGVFLMFGAKFWHEVLEIVFDTRDRIKRGGVA